MSTFKKEVIRILIFLAIITAVLILKWWSLIVAFAFFPKIFKHLKNSRNGKCNIGYLVNYLTERIVSD